MLGVNLVYDIVILVEYCALGWRGPVLVLEDLMVGWYM